MKYGAEISSSYMAAIKDVELSSLECRKTPGENHPRNRGIKGGFGSRMIDALKCFDVDNPLWKCSKPVSTSSKQFSRGERTKELVDPDT